MQIRLSKIISKIFFISLIIAIPAGSFGESMGDFPFHIGETVKKEMMYNYAFEEVWESALLVLKNIDNVVTREMQEKGIKSFKTNIISDKSSGLITYTTTHLGEKGFFRASVLPKFTYQTLLVKSLENKKTRIYYHEITYISYNEPAFTEDIIARRLDFTPSGESIFKEIQKSLRKNTYENP